MREITYELSFGSPSYPTNKSHTPMRFAPLRSSLLSTSIALFIGTASAQTVLPEYVNFSDTSRLTMGGSVATTGTGSSTALRLTDNAVNQSGGVFFNSAISLNSLSTSFTFRLNGSGGGNAIADSSGAQRYGDGFAFVLKSNTVTATHGANGGGLGYSGFDSSSFNSIAVVFDTYKNGDLGDPSSNFIGFAAFGSVNHTSNPSWVAPVSGNFSDGQIWTAWIDFVTGSGLQIRVAQGDLTSAQRPGSANLTISDLSMSENALMLPGFTAATGGAYMTQDILKWSFSNTYLSAGQTAGAAAISAIPEPADYAALFGLGTLGFVFFRRRQAKAATPSA